MNHTASVKSLIKIVFKLSLVLLAAYWFFTGLLTPSIAQEDSTGSAEQESISEQIKEKISQVQSQTRTRKAAYVGEVKSMTDSTLTVSTRTGDKQVAISDDATVINQVGARKTVTSEDIAIGDYVITMGSLSASSNGTLTATRILIIKKPDPLKRMAVNGKVTEAGKDTLKIETKSRGEWQIEIGSDTTIKRVGEKEELEITDLELGDRIVAAGTETENKTVEARLVIVLSSLPNTTQTPEDQ